MISWIKNVLALLLLFALSKVAFLLAGAQEEPFTLGDALDVVRSGFTQDLSTVAYLVVVPFLAAFVALWAERLPLRRVLTPYYIVIGVLLAAIIVGDIALYPFWKFKLNAIVLSYLTSPEGTTNSVSLGFILSRLAAMGVVAAGVAFVCVKLTPRHLSPTRHRVGASLAMTLMAGLLFVCIRGGVQEGTMNVGVAYYSQRLYLNHAAVNPAFSLLSSLLHAQGDLSRQYDYLTEARRDEVFRGLYPGPADDLADTLLTTTRPNILLIIMESYGGKFVKELGGLPEVSPNLSRLIPEGVFWTNYYSNSFRTDRGLVSALSGHISYPTVSLMKNADLQHHLPGLARTLRGAHYATHYLYGGDITVFGQKGYLVGSGFETLTSDGDFSTREVNASKWGADDGICAQRVLAQLKDIRQQPFFYTFQTLSSHEPFEVPYHRLADKRLNAFAFADSCVGALVDNLRKTPLWNNLLIVIIPDHGFLYDLTYEDPAFFHSPMLWLGGALKKPRRIETLMNQSDIAATLLAQLRLPHADYPWSRNVLSPTYTYPFAYSTFAGGILFKDSTGVSVYDITSNRPITESPAPSPRRIERAKAILQTSYDRIAL